MFKMWQKINKFFDKLEDRVRGKLSRRPIIYGFLGGVGIVLFWRGVWHTADYISELIYYTSSYGPGSVVYIEARWWDGPLSLLIGSILLLVTGLFVSSFIGNEVIISGLKGERKLTEKTEEEIRQDSELIQKTIAQIKEIRESIEEIDKIIKEIKYK